MHCEWFYMPLALSLGTVLYIFILNVVTDVRQVEKYHESQYSKLYNMGDILNLPRLHESITSAYQKIPHYDYWQYERACTTFVPSVVSYYCALRQDENEIIPNATKVRQAVKLYFEEHGRDMKYINDIQTDTSLCVHVRSGDKGLLSANFLQAIRSLSFNYSSIYFLSGIHNAAKGKHVNDRQTLDSSISLIRKSIINPNTKLVFTSNTPDTDICFMMKCRNLLLHKGGFSELGSFVFEGDKLYITESFPFDRRKDEHVKNMIVKPKYLRCTPSHCDMIKL